MKMEITMENKQLTTENTSTTENKLLGACVGFSLKEMDYGVCRHGFENMKILHLSLSG